MELEQGLRFLLLLLGKGRPLKQILRSLVFKVSAIFKCRPVCKTRACARSSIHRDRDRNTFWKKAQKYSSSFSSSSSSSSSSFIVQF